MYGNAIITTLFFGVFLQIFDEQPSDSANNNATNPTSDETSSKQVIPCSGGHSLSSVTVTTTTITPSNSTLNLSSRSFTPVSSSSCNTLAPQTISSEAPIAPVRPKRSKREKSANRNSIYGSCIRPPKHSPPYSEASTPLPEANSESEPPPRRHSMHSDAVQSQHQFSDDLRGLIVHRNVPHKPPLPPRNRPINNNYKPPQPPSDPKPFYPARGDSPAPLLRREKSSLDNIIGPEFTFTFSKSLPSPKVTADNSLDNHRWTAGDSCSDDLNVVTQTQNDFNANKENVFFNVRARQQAKNDEPKQLGESWTVKNGSSNAGLVRSTKTEPLAASQPLSSSSSSGSSQSGTSVRTNSLPRMGLKGKTAAKWFRNSLGPPPVPPPKGLPNPLAPFRSTEVLDKRQFWVSLDL